MSLDIVIIYNQDIFNYEISKKLLKQNIKVLPFKKDIILNNQIVIYITSFLSNKIETYKFVKNENILSSSLITSYFEETFKANNIYINTTCIKENNFYFLLNKNHLKTIMLNIPKNIDINDAFLTIFNLYNSFKNYELKDLIFNYLTLIPKNKVSTYKDIAVYIKNKNYSRVVGNILHNNKNQFLYPCYKIVNAKGLLSTNYAFGGINAQKQLLIADKIEVKNNKVNLKRYKFSI